MARQLRLSPDNYLARGRYFLTFCTFERRSTFVDAPVIASVLAEFRRTSALESFAILAYCFMPDHVHPLVEACAEACDLRRTA